MKKLLFLCTLLAVFCAAAAPVVSGAPQLRFAQKVGKDFVITNTAPRKGQVAQNFILNQKTVKPFTFGVLAKVQHKDVGKFQAILRADLTFMDGSTLPWVNIGIPVTDQFQVFSRTFTPPKPVKSAYVIVMFEGVGTARFSDLFLREETPAPYEYALGAEPEKLGKLKDFRRDLCLTTDLTRAAIVVPDTPEGKKYAASIRALLPAAQVVPASTYDKALKLDRNLILVGNRDNNTVIDHFYLLHKVLLDCYYPGKGGYTVRSLHNPFGDKHNVIFAGGSDDAGTADAVKQLLKRIREHQGKLPWTQDIKLAPELKAPFSANAVPIWEESRGYGSQGYFGWQSFSRNMMVYYMTGEKRYLDELIRLAFHAKPDELFKIDDESHHHLPDPMLEPYHYRWVMTPVLWDLVEESPHLSDADRLRVTAKLYEMLKLRISKRYWFSLANSGKRRMSFLPNRHVSWESVIVWATADYINRHYDCYEGKHALYLANNMLWPLDHYASLKTGSNFWYNTFIQPFFVYAAMAKGRNAIGMPALRHLANGLTAFADLRQGDWSQHYSSAAFLRLAGHLVQDQGTYHLADLLGTPDVPFRAGFSFLTTKSYPRNFFAETSGKFYTYAADLRGADWWNDCPFPKEEIIEWLTWREKPADTGDFLVLCPYPGIASREPFHNYALRTARIGDDLLLSGYRTQLDLFADGTTPGKEARYGRVTGRDIVGKDTVVIRGEVRKYNGFDWKRTILLRKNRFLLFWDEVTPLAPYRDVEIVNRFQVQGASRKTGEDICITVAAPNRTDESTLYTKTPAYEILKANPHAPKPYMQGYAGFEGVKPGMVLNVPFVMPETADAGLFLQIGCHVDRRSDLRIKLDGKTVVEKFRPITPGRSVPRVSLGKHRITAGKHLVTVEILNVDPANPERTIAALGDLEVSRKFTLPQPRQWTLATSTTGRKETIGGMVNFHSYAAGSEPVRFASILRSGAPDKAVPSAQEMANGMIRLQLPETAWIRPTKDGFELLEKDRKTLIPYSGSITVTAAESFPENLQPARRSDSKTGKITPFANPVWDQPLEKGPICMMQPVGDKLAVVQKNTVTLFNPDGTVERTYRVKANIGDFCYYAPRDLFLVGSMDELLTAIDRKTGKVLWTFTSEMNEVLKASSAFYGMKCTIPGISGVRVFTLNNKPVIFAGSTGTVELVDLDGKLLSRNQHGSGGYLSRFAELPGKGVLGVRHSSTPDLHLTMPNLKTRSYGMSTDANGYHMGNYGFGCVSHHLTTVAQLRPGEPHKIISLFNGTMTRLGIWNANGRIERDVSFGSGSGKGGGYGAFNLGQSNMRDLLITDLDKDGVQEIILAYNRRIVTVFDPDLKLLQLIRLETEPCTLAAVNGMIVVGCFNGDLLWFSRDGKLLKKASLDGCVSAIRVIGNTLYAGTARGSLAAFRIQ